MARGTNMVHKQMKDAALARVSVNLNAPLDEHLKQAYRKVLASGKL
jgi:hypothetical protein